MIGIGNIARFHRMIQNDLATRPGAVHQTKNRQSTNLMWGVKSGRINRDEFTYLGNYANETERLRGLYGKNGLNPREKAILASRQRHYDRMYQRYSYGNYHPRVRARDDIQARQLNQLNRIYNGARSGSLTVGEGRYLLNRGKDISYRKGVYQRYGNPWTGRLSGYERFKLHGALNRNSRNIFRLKHNWNFDWGSMPPWFGRF